MGILTGKRVLITGAGGFIGSHIIKRLLKEGAGIYALDKKDITAAGIFYFHADICDRTSLGAAIISINPQIIVHLAACLDKNASEVEMMRINYQGTANLIDALESMPYERFVYISTSELYFGNGVPFSEQMPLHPQAAYARSKLMAEEYCMRQFNEKSKPITILRPSIVYGPGQAGSMFIPQCITSALKGEDMKMTAGEQTRDFVYVEDVVEAILKGSYVPAAAGEIINIGSGIETTLKAAALKINELAGKTMRIDFGALPYRENEIWHYVLDIEKAKTTLGWQPLTAFAEGLRATLLSYRQPL
ncbi:MAG TPA: NAD(P)-dependent oxidoreductase [Nanoarchaeota archaeon]|nr:NAD(P)-dependent oxidoreductase [Nanoarchaeota archaeon]